MDKTLQDLSKTDAPVASLSLNAQFDAESPESTKDAANSILAPQGEQLEEVKSEVSTELKPICKRGLFRKSQSMGSGLCHEGSVLSNSEMEEEMDQGFSDSHDSANNQEVESYTVQNRVPRSESAQVDSDLGNNQSIFSIGDLMHLGKESLEKYERSPSGEPSSPRMVVKSSSLPNMRCFSAEHSGKHFAPRSRSSEDMHALHMKSREVSFYGAEMRQAQEKETRDDAYKMEKSNCDDSLDDGCNSSNYSASAKDWIVPDELIIAKQHQGESSTQQGDEGKDFKIKRIEDWVNDLQHCNPLEELNEQQPLNNFSPDKDSTVVSGVLPTSKTEIKVSPGMEAAKRYISTLSAAATAAQLSNHGLTVIPFLSAFVSLRVLNLSGNSIAKITSGSLPRGLHMLNLSKNNISTIEGLRELSRLRVLDLSYNRIFRIGRGLASCSSLKELYLAGNKISEVEGLHRLLKLTVLDLGFNKISTAKCLGQLAANYNSLQAISLEGNPAQKNVGEDQLKKYLQNLLPNIVYYNRQAIKLSTSKDAADRSVRLGIQSDRALRSDKKAARKGSHAPSGSRPSSLSSHVRKSQGLASPKQSRGSRPGHFPPAGSKGATSLRHNFVEFSSKILSLRSELSMRRVRSEGTLGAL